VGSVESRCLGKGRERSSCSGRGWGGYNIISYHRGNRNSQDSLAK
jgi:hypothetical protein